MMRKMSENQGVSARMHANTLIFGVSPGINGSPLLQTGITIQKYMVPTPRTLQRDVRKDTQRWLAALWAPSISSCGLLPNAGRLCGDYSPGRQSQHSSRYVDRPCVWAGYDRRSGECRGGHSTGKYNCHVEKLPDESILRAGEVDGSFARVELRKVAEGAG